MVKSMEQREYDQLVSYAQLIEELEELRQENMELKNRIEELEIENHYNEHQLNYTVHMLSKIHNVIEDTGLFNNKEETL